MNRNELLDFFDTHLDQIFAHKGNNLIGFIGEVVKEKGVKELLIKWPDEIKIKVTQKFLENSSLTHQLN